MNKPHIYFNRVWKSWAVQRNRAGTDAFIHAMGFAYKLNEEQAYTHDIREGEGAGDYVPLWALDREEDPKPDGKLGVWGLVTIAGITTVVAVALWAGYLLIDLLGD